jgi:hypothetical protein
VKKLGQNRSDHHFTAAIKATAPIVKQIIEILLIELAKLSRLVGKAFIDAYLG